MNREREDAGEPLFANPRNAAAGTMRNLDPALVSKRGLSAFTYQVRPIHSGDGAGIRGVPDAQQSRARRWRRCAGGDCLSKPHWRRCDGIDAVIAFCREWADKRQGLEFDTDGVVIKVDDLALRETPRRDGEVSHGGRPPSSSPPSRRIRS